MVISYIGFRLCSDEDLLGWQPCRRLISFGIGTRVARLDQDRGAEEAVTAVHESLHLFSVVDVFLFIRLCWV